MNATVLPSWTATPVDGTAVHAVPLPGLAAAAAALGAPPASVLLAAHLRVAGLLAGETEVSAGPAAVVLDAGSWRDLVRAVGAHALPLECAHRGLTARYSDRQVLIEYDRRRFDAAHVSRIGGYLAAALAAMAADPDAAYSTCDLLSAPEREHQLHGLGGAVRELPAQRFHELFAAVAASRPDAVAIVHNGQTWSYGWLDRTANRIAHALLARGLRAEEIVAVHAERGARWLAAIIGIFRAGGAYLPIEPDHPPARVATLLAQSRCRLVLRDDGAPPVGPDAVVLPITEVAAAGPDDAPRVDVGPDQLAYVYFTSGSTGLPKGAMCEHAGMINHLLAKIEDLGLDEHSVVVQNAQASFDISLWQAIAPLLVGGRTVIVGREDILDVRRFLDTVVGAGATVLQLVPSYLDVVLRHTESDPRDLGALRCVSVTGEAISKPLVNRFFAQYPGLSLVNAYGATEASDDTTHEIMAAPPAEELVPVGRPVRNVTVTVLGPDDALVPLGAPGEIAFSGVCVGRGYVNEPTRTAQAFGPDPLRPGQRMYRTGDFGRWLPTGHLEFHGRRDEQVKINGVRIELGEVESRILEHPRVLGASVVVTALPGSGKSMVAFYTPAGGPTPDELAAHLRNVLPAAAVPARLHVIDALPLNSNGKVDKRALIARAADASPPVAAGELHTDTERRIAQAWAAALNRPPDSIGREDHFFDVGGGSLSALRVVAALNGLISLDDLIRRPVLADLAAAAHAPDGSEREPATLLRLLAGPASGASVALVCLPYAAGSAINFQPLAAALASADPTVAVYALQPPGHDLANRGEALLEVDELAKLIADEAGAIGAPLAFWGHCAGAPLALECALRLGATAVVRHVFVAARLLEPDADLTREIAAVVAAHDTDLADELAAQGALDGAELSPADRAFVGRVYRHDTRTANQWLLDAPRRSTPPTLGCPITVVVAGDDPLTPGPFDRYGDWRTFGDDVRLAEMDGGGHLFPRTRPAATAALVLRAIRQVEVDA